MADHVHHLHQAASNKLLRGIFLSGLILVLELIGGIMANSLALLSDAGHVFADIIALLLSWYGLRQSERPASTRMTFGYHRVGVLIALFNVVSISIIAGVVFYEAYHRWLQPPEVRGTLMLGIAFVGLVANGIVALWLRGEQHANLNIRSAFWHVLGDALASVGVIAGALIIMFTGLYRIDPIISVMIGIIIAVAAWSILREGLRVILEATPHEVDVDRMAAALAQLPGVKDVHDIHVWSISSEIHAMSCHVAVADVALSEATNIRRKIEEVLRDEFHIEHSVLQMECPEGGPNDLFCNLTLKSPDEDAHKPEG